MYCMMIIFSNTVLYILKLFIEYNLDGLTKKNGNYVICWRY